MKERINALGRAALRSNEGGFTLIELILVTVIIGILAGMVALNVGDVSTSARIKAAKGDIATLETAVDLYKLENYDNPPSNLGALVPKYIKELKPDPWGNQYQLQGDRVVSGGGGDSGQITSSSEHAN